MHGKGLNYVVTRHTFQAVVCQSVGSFVWLACGLQCLCRAWLNSTYLHFPITSISSLGFSPWHFRHWQSFINAPPPLAFQALISASDRRNVKHKRQYHLGRWEWFSSGSQKMEKKHQNPSCFVIALLLSAVLYLSESDEGWWGWWQSGAGSALVALQLSQTYLFVLFGWINVILLDIMSYFFIHINYNYKTFYLMTSEQNEYIMGIIYSLNNNDFMIDVMPRLK